MLVPAFRCPICGSPLERRAEAARCAYCGSEEGPGEPGDPAPWRCPLGHFVCSECRTSSAADLPGRIVRNRTMSDPVALAELTLSHPAFRQEAYGPDHHGVPAAAVLVSLRNAGLWNGSDQRILLAARRGRELPAGSCFLSGTCGACVSAGAAVSAALGLDIRDDRRGEALGAVSSALGRLALAGGIRCCKEAVYAAIEAAMDCLAHLIPGAERLRRRPEACAFWASMPECKGQSCPYHPEHAAGRAP